MNSKVTDLSTVGNELATPGERHELARDDGGANQYLTFCLSDEGYGVDILRVQEIKGWTPVTRIPNAPEYLRGVLNLRGAIVPIIDLRMRFGMDNVEYTATTVVIVLSVRREGRERIIGVVVDGVEDVLNVNPAEIKPAPDFGATINTEFISGLATVDEKMVMLLDIDRLLSIDQLQGLDAVIEN